MPDEITENLSLSNDDKPLPKGWRLVKLGDVCEVYTGTRDPRKNPEIHFKYIDIASVDNTTKRITESRNILGKDAPSRARQIVLKDDVIVATTRPNLNAVAIVPETFDNQICSTGFCVLRSTNKINSSYLFSFVKSEQFIESLSDLVKGALYPAVTDKQVKSQFIPLPPTIEEQKRIAAILDEQMKAVEEARLAVEAQLEAANLLPNAFLRAVFESEDARNWEKRKLGEIATKIGSGITPRGGQSSYKSSGIPLIRSQNVHLNKFSYNGLAHITEEQDLAMESSRVFENDVLLNITGASIGRVCVVPTEVCPANVNQHVSIIRVNGKLNSNYLSFYLSNPDFQDFILDNQSGATRQALTKALIENFNVPIPPTLEKQEYISDKLNEQMKEVEALKKSITEKLEAVKKLPAAILRKAFAGEV